VRTGNKWGYIDKTGAAVIAALYDDASAFSDGLAQVQENTSKGYISRTGKFVLVFP
jgi:hypothetical protein